MSTKDEIFDYVMNSPENTNPSVLRSQLDSLETPSELPPVTGDDNGKVLGVVNGEWDKTNIPTASNSTKGGIKVGDGLAISSEKLAVKAATEGAILVNGSGVAIDLEKLSEVYHRRCCKREIAVSGTTADDNVTVTYPEGVQNEDLIYALDGGVPEITGYKDLNYIVNYNNGEMFCTPFCMSNLYTWFRGVKASSDPITFGAALPVNEYIIGLLNIHSWPGGPEDGVIYIRELIPAT